MSLKINEDQKAFKMPISHLFEIIESIVASPHQQITYHDKQRAAKIFLALQSYVGNHVFIEQDGSPRIDPDFALDFDGYVESIFDGKELDEIYRM